MSREEKRTAVSTAEILKVFIPAAKAGKSRDEIAAALGMDPNSFGVRMSNIRKTLLEKEGVVLPKLHGTRGGTDWAAIGEQARSLLGETDEDEDE